MYKERKKKKPETYVVGAGPGHRHVQRGYGNLNVAARAIGVAHARQHVATSANLELQWLLGLASDS